MPLNDIYTCQQISDAFNNALDYLGNSSKEALLHMLTTEKGIRFAGRDCSRIEEIEQALYEIFDHGAEIILNLFNNQLAKS